MTRRRLVCEPLTAAAFAPFGEVIEAGDRTPVTINGGLTDKFAPLALLGVDAGAELMVALYRSRPVTLPYALAELERHPLACQLFMPLDRRPFPVVVASGEQAPAPSALRAFMSDGRQGVCLHPGTWHHHQLSLGASCDYLVIERRTEAGNLDTVVLAEPVWLDGVAAG